jgi:signal transduction histidine kinase
VGATADDIHLQVVDNGVGFAARRAFGPGHQGLRNMRERAEGMGGVLEIESGPARGTRIIVVVPHSEARGGMAGVEDGRSG